MHGAGEEWIPVSAGGSKKGAGALLMQFQYKGLYPALEEASRMSPSFRSKLEHLTDQVECSVCSGSRLRDDAAAVRFRDRTMDDMCRLALGDLLKHFRRSSSPRLKRRSPASWSAR